jgi:hypothetical protein
VGQVLDVGLDSILAGHWNVHNLARHWKVCVQRLWFDHVHWLQSVVASLWEPTMLPPCHLSRRAPFWKCASPTLLVGVGSE